MILIHLKGVKLKRRITIESFNCNFQKSFMIIFMLGIKKTLT